MAKGGRVGGNGLQGGIQNAVSSVLSHFPGLVVTSTTGGTHAKNSYHYRGEAVDFSNGTGKPRMTIGSTKRSLSRTL